MTIFTHLFPVLERLLEGVLSANPMDRQHLTTSDEDLVAEFGRVLELFGRALTTRSDLSAFCQHVNASAAQGFTWLEALEKAAESKG